MLTQKIKCPNCKAAIDVTQVLYDQVNETVGKDQAAAVRVLELDVLTQKQKLKDQGENLSSKFKTELVQQRQALTASIRASVEEETATATLSMETELKEKTERLKEANTLKAELSQLKRDSEELESKVRASALEESFATLEKEKEKASRDATDKAQLKIAEKEHTIQSLRSSLADAQQKAEQGSMQIQGEVQELAIEDWLRKSFPLDIVGEIKKGARGADCLQTINTRYKNNCGQIYYESKRSKHFQKSWIQKFKEDLQDRGASIGVLVTETMPDGMERMGQMSGVWVCTLDEFKSLCAVLRESLINIDNVLMAGTNKGDKMEMLYGYLTSGEFKLQVESVVEGFVQMRQDLESEKRSMQNIWKKREKQLDKVTAGPIAFHGSIKGIAGSAVQPVALLELQG